jgi:hypothetical protein
MEIRIIARDGVLWDVELWDPEDKVSTTILTATNKEAAKAIALALEPFVNDILT